MSRNRRRNRIRRDSAGPMYVLAGLPPALHGWARDIIRDAVPGTATVVGAPSSARDGNLYADALVRTLLRAATEFAVRRRTRGPLRPIAPKSITLLYVPAPDDERLLSAFDFALMSHPMTALMARDPNGRQLRHVRAAVELAVAEAIKPQGRAKGALDVVAERINRLSDQEALLLPPRNFHTETGRLAERFLDLRRGARPWNDRFADLVVEDLTHRQVERIPTGRTRRVFVDVRRVAFFTAHPAAFHGDQRELAAAAPDGEQRSLLRSFYRFGAALPAGFHHDAQRNDGSGFRAFEFDCEREGRVSVTAPYVNIYPNDFVRPGEN